MYVITVPKCRKLPVSSNYAVTDATPAGINATTAAAGGGATSTTG